MLELDRNQASRHNIAEGSFVIAHHDTPHKAFFCPAGERLQGAADHHPRATTAPLSALFSSFTPVTTLTTEPPPPASPPNTATATTHTMSSQLRLGSTAPDFEAETTNGPIKFHDFIGDSW